VEIHASFVNTHNYEAHICPFLESNTSVECSLYALLRCRDFVYMYRCYSGLRNVCVILCSELNNLVSRSLASLQQYLRRFSSVAASDILYGMSEQIYFAYLDRASV
jgi:hypothetical protein